MVRANLGKPRNFAIPAGRTGPAGGTPVKQPDTPAENRQGIAKALGKRLPPRHPSGQ
jgi:hypothetical protein